MGKNKRFLIIVCIVFPLAVIGILFMMINGSSRTNDSVAPNEPYTSETATVTTLTSTSRWYDPALLAVGDKVGGWQVVDNPLETYGKDSKAFTLEGEAIVSGTYKVTYEEDTYNSNQIVFLADEDSSSTLPQPFAFKGTASRMILHVVNPENRTQFGPPGSKGHVTITIRQYHSVYADIIEGVADSTNVIQISQITSTPPPQSEVPQAELMQALRASPLPSFKMSTNADIADPETYNLLQDWLKQLNKQFMAALSPYNTKRISPEQKEQIQTWLLLAFTEAKAKEVAAISLPQSGIHYLVAYSLLDLFPFSEVKEIKNQFIQSEGADTIRYTGVYILSGTHDAQFSYTLKHIDGVWKLDQVEIKQI